MASVVRQLGAGRLQERDNQHFPCKLNQAHIRVKTPLMSTANLGTAL